jgi:hypothetical protein
MPPADVQRRSLTLQSAASPPPASCAALFTWALDRPISDEQARRCAKRQQGRSWEVVESELGALGEFKKLGLKYV